MARTVDFGHALTGHQPAPMALEPLGHEIRRDAPAGVASGLATVATSPQPALDHWPLTASVRSAASHDRPDRHVAREPARLAGGPVKATSDVQRDAAPPAAGRVSAPAPSGGTRSAPQIVHPSRRPEPAAALTHVNVPLPANPGGTIGRARVPGTTPLPANPGGGTPPVPAAAPVTPSVSREAANPGAGPSRTASAPSGERGAVPTRRIRIGAPLDGVSSEFRLIGRSTAPPTDAPVAGDDAASRGLTVRALRPDGPDTTGDPHQPTPDPGAAAERPVAPTVGSTAPAPGDTRGPAEADGPVDAGPAEAPAPAGTSVGAAPPVVPVVISPGAPRPPIRPLVGGISVAREVAAGSGPAPRRTPQATAPSTVERRPALDAVLADLAGSGASTSTGGPTSAGRAGTSDTVASRSSVDAAGPWLRSDGPGGHGPAAARQGMAGPSSSTRATAGTSEGGRLGPSAGATVARSPSLPPDRWQSPIRRVVSAARTSGVATDSGIGSVQRVTDGSPGFRPAGGAPTGSSMATGDRGADVAIEATDGVDDAVIQRLLLPGATPPDGGLPPSGTVVSRQTDGSSTGGAASGGGATGSGDKELDELARKLFPRLQLRLRHELLVDRERIGSLVDFGR